MLHQDLILVEASPLLLSADTEYLATLAPVIFLTVEAGKVSVNALKRAAALMERLRPAGIAAILHGVSLKSFDSQLGGVSWSLKPPGRQVETIPALDSRGNVIELAAMVAPEIEISN